MSCRCKGVRFMIANDFVDVENRLSEKPTGLCE